MPTTLDCLNQDVLNVIRSLQDADDPHVLNDIITLYLDTSRDLCEALITACEHTGDLDLVRTSAHTLKGSSANVGAQRLAAACADLEAIARSERCDGLTQALDKLLVEYECACQALTLELGDKAA